MRFNLTIGNTSFSVCGKLAKIKHNGKTVFAKCGSKVILTNIDLKKDLGLKEESKDDLN